MKSFSKVIIAAGIVVPVFLAGCGSGGGGSRSAGAPASGVSGSGAESAKGTLGPKSFFGDFFAILIGGLLGGFDFDGYGDNIADNVDAQVDALTTTIDEGSGRWSGTLLLQLDECTPESAGTEVDRTIDVRIDGDDVEVSDEYGRVYLGQTDTFISFLADWYDPVSQSSSTIDFLISNGSSLVTIRDEFVANGQSCAREYFGNLVPVSTADGESAEFPA